MKTMILRIFLAGFFAMVSCTHLSYADPPVACSCLKPLSPTKELKGATAVFVGEVCGITENRDSLSAEFSLEQVWKGSSQKQIIVQTSKYGSDCGIGFRMGVKYLVYAYGKDVLNVSRCSRTKEVDQAQEDLRELKEGKQP
jgi:hypothetical protein